MSFSEFSKKDYELIQQEWETLKVLARERCKDDSEFKVVEKAFEFANQAHRNVRRRSGEPYIFHPIAVAKIVVEEIGLGYKSISAALLHDVVEDTEYTLTDINNLFGEKITSLVDGLTKIKTVLDNEDKKNNGITFTESLQAENFKRILLTLNDDVRVVLIKLADRLHNCRTIESMPERKRDKILSETMFIFIPLAHRLGLYSVKSEMENIWLKYKEPDEYNEISEKINQNVAKRSQEIQDFISPIEDALKATGFKFEIKRRVKTPYSIYYKMRKKQVPFEQIFDLYAVRIIYDPSDNDPDTEKRDAYMIYVTLLNLYHDQQSRFRDWIKQPKSNGYEALHCTLMSHAGFWVEVQIRSRRMDDIAEKGIAAHWAYKNHGYIKENESEMDKWLARVQDVLLSKDINAIELLDIIHGDLVSSDIVVFTPKGEQKTIQNGSTVLDFAYMIHTHIGNTAIASKVNMKLSPLSQVLKAGDQVEIITARSGQPKLEWLQFLHTRHAQNVVLEYFKSSHDEIAESGKQIFNERLNAFDVKPTHEIIKRFMDYTQLNDLEELYFRIGAGLVGPEDFKIILLGEKENAGKKENLFTDNKSLTKKNYVLADCCNPIPGDAVVGIISGKDTIVVHKKSCPVAENIAAKYGEKVVVPEWTTIEQEFPVRISLKGIDKIGMLSEITNYISNVMGVNMRKLQLGGENGVFEGYIEMLVRDKRNLQKMLEDLRKIDGIEDVVRTDI